MITETGKVIAIKEIEGEIVVEVECISKSACSSCHSQASCGVGTVSKAFTDKSHRFDMPYQKGMEVNHFIDLNVSNGDLIKSATLAYLLPLFFFIGSALVIKTLFDVNEGAIISGSALFAAIGFIVTRYFASKLFPQKKTSDLITTQPHK